MWQVARQQSVKHYGMLEDFVSMVTEAVPQLLTDRQRRLLLLALRAKVTLSDPQVTLSDPQVTLSDPQVTLSDPQVTLSDPQVTLSDPQVTLSDPQVTLSDPQVTLSDPQAGPTHLEEHRSEDTMDDETSSLQSLLTQSPDDRQRLLQEVFDHSFDSALQELISDFLSRTEQLFPVPDFKQTACWLSAAPGGFEECLQEAEHLRELLTNQSCQLGKASTTVSQDTENVLLTAWSHPLLNKPANQEPPPDNSQSEALPDVQSDPPPDVQSEAVPDVQSEPLFQVKVEVMVLTEDQEETVIGQSEEQEASNQSAAGGGDSWDVTPVIVEVHRLKESPGDSADQSEDTGDQSDQSPEAPPPRVYRASPAQRVAHKCPRCGKCFIYRSQVIRHLSTSKSCSSALRRASSTQAPPPDCSASFRSQAELRSHQRSHRSRTLFSCSSCERTFTHLQVFPTARQCDAHRLQHRPPPLTCTVCPLSFSSQSRLLRHLQTHSAEGAELQFSCRFCDLTFPGVTQLRIHQRSHSSRLFPCDLCSKAFGSASGLQSHRSNHGLERRFLCAQCGKRFKTRHGLEGHLRTHSGERPFTCPHCPKDFTALAGLNVHVRRHTGERPYVCTVCGKGWPSGGDLQKHMRMHTGERPYRCQDCGKAFSISCHLTEHRRIHTGERPFPCPQCGKCLRRKFDLEKHLLSHSDVRPGVSPPPRHLPVNQGEASGHELLVFRGNS
ncbi:Zinc finger protein ZFMSA12A [Dissostichus eleginoides]|uniref:Zinc finger protein ZFMSA12A n=1 Tax=Dissostichus eleginoides TaxID=100907 RepID=A0AAD9B3Y3_DISEL|nr:Zinc finger protein ZFMSA12A [Dissostichus eleginoides]